MLAPTTVATLGRTMTRWWHRERRFFCDNTACARRTFVEQVPDLTTPYGRRTPLLRGVLEKVALALGGRPGARMTRLLAVEASCITMLRLARALPVPVPGTIAVVGVDDFAFRSTISRSARATATARSSSTWAPAALAGFAGRARSRLSALRGLP
jgi:hypothetical protein